MNNKNIETSNEKEYSFPRLKSYSIDEVLAAGGTTAFANKIGKNPENIEIRLKKLPKDAFLTDDEVTQALKMLNESK
jgi:hypothetical protein